MVDRFRVQFEGLRRLLMQAEFCGAVTPEDAEKHAKALRDLEQQVADARFRRDGSLPPLLRTVDNAQAHLSGLLN